MSTTGPFTIQRLVGVYDADGTLRGEVAYVLGHLIGRRTCSLCDITHSWRGRKHDFDELAEGLGVPFDLVHRDEVPDDVTAVATAWPCVLVITGAGPSVLLDDAALEDCGGEPDALLDALDAAVAARGLTLPAAAT